MILALPIEQKWVVAKIQYVTNMLATTRVLYLEINEKTKHV